MERKIGEIFEYNGEWYQCIKDTEYTSCINCCFYNGGHKLCTDEDMGACVKEYRSDAKSICFKKLEKVGEPYLFQGRTFQTYNVFIEPSVSEDIGLIIIPSKNINTVEIEIKQNKEDMEENYKAEDTPLTRLVGRYVNNLIDYETFEKAVKELYSDKKDSNSTLKEFDIEAAKEGKPVCTRDGRKARIICYDKHGGLPIVALVETKVNGRISEEIALFYIDGCAVSADIDSKLDLMMLTEKKEGWVNVYNNPTTHNIYTSADVFESKEIAEEQGTQRNRIATCKITWEE